MEQQMKNLELKLKQSQIKFSQQEEELEGERLQNQRILENFNQIQKIRGLPFLRNSQYISQELLQLKKFIGQNLPVFGKNDNSTQILSEKNNQSQFLNTPKQVQVGDQGNYSVEENTVQRKSKWQSEIQNLKQSLNSIGGGDFNNFSTQQNQQTQNQNKANNQMTSSVRSSQGRFKSPARSILKNKQRNSSSQLEQSQILKYNQNNQQNYEDNNSQLNNSQKGFNFLQNFLNNQNSSQIQQNDSQFYQQQNQNFQNSESKCNQSFVSQQSVQQQNVQNKQKYNYLRMEQFGIQVKSKIVEILQSLNNFKNLIKNKNFVNNEGLQILEDKMSFYREQIFALDQINNQDQQGKTDDLLRNFDLVMNDINLVEQGLICKSDYLLQKQQQIQQFEYMNQNQISRNNYNQQDQQFQQQCLNCENQANMLKQLQNQAQQQENIKNQKEKQIEELINSLELIKNNESGFENQFQLVKKCLQNLSDTVFEELIIYENNQLNKIYEKFKGLAQNISEMNLFFPFLEIQNQELKNQKQTNLLDRHKIQYNLSYKNRESLQKVGNIEIMQINFDDKFLMEKREERLQNV
ncbi:hypothetical protein PPERSA_11086 [Pseudocohnilembus persalinus]|uniref:Uncharacterized protein n=1 Tax=Pseudocohnilembus persalinus TaxID=266149 RepID=A0A0V0QZB5_PSEPJ|nr:hypothetical protein PPERSA_11086 [Pseudocohnilembus persalinus]|eukprot:KRX07537.1 hypothetical protein PPERSA_11086 [Pseudocohnilembus persalinus]